jgi:hypothetical protein
MRSMHVFCMFWCRVLVSSAFLRTLVVAFFGMDVLQWMWCNGSMIVNLNVSTRACARTPSHLRACTLSHLGIRDDIRHSSSRSQSLCGWVWVCVCVYIRSKAARCRRRRKMQATPQRRRRQIKKTPCHRIKRPPPRYSLGFRIRVQDIGSLLLPRPLT